MDDLGEGESPIPEDDEEEGEAEAEEGQENKKADATKKEEKEVDVSKMSSYERQQYTLQQKIAALEERIAAPRTWELTGEVDAGHRPADSLLQTDIDFDHIGVTSTAVDESVAQDIDTMIKRRIKDKAWDDPERKAEPEEKQFKPMEEVSAEKSQFGLAELYERDAQAQAAAASDNPLPTEKETALQKEHQELAGLFAALCHKLDALSNFHFTPKPPRLELTVTTQAPALQMEEVIPVAVSDAQLAAPHEVFASAAQGMPATSGEKSREEKKAEHRRKKAARKKRAEARTADEDAKAAAKARLLGESAGGLEKGKKGGMKKSKKVVIKGAEARRIQAALNQSNVTRGTESVGQAKFSKSTDVFSKLAAGGDDAGKAKKRKEAGGGGDAAPSAKKVKL